MSEPAMRGGDHVDHPRLAEVRVTAAVEGEDPQEDDDLGDAVERGVVEGAEDGGRPGAAGDLAVEDVEDAAEQDEEAARSRTWPRKKAMPAEIVTRKPTVVTVFGCTPRAMRRPGRGWMRPRKPVADAPRDAC